MLSKLLSTFAATLALLVNTGFAESPGNDVRPNILWLSTEDIGQELNCYGDSTAKTPSLDALASRSQIYDVAWSTYPVCAPARTTIITGMYAGSLGAGNMRSNVALPEGLKLFPEYLREAGYYCTNNSKTDYNVKPNAQVWDESSRKAHYSKRSSGQPFFAVFNYTRTHESKIRTRPHEQVVDPASVKLKSYWPDTPEVRQDWAQYYDNIQSLDGWIGKHLKQLEKAGLAEDTFVFFFGDHGSGMPRHKRYAGESGLGVPFLVHVPEKFKHLAKGYQAGKHTRRPIGFVDLAPTVLSLAGIEPPDFMEGNAFMGKFERPPSQLLFGYRERMDSKPDLSRVIRDDRFVYVRNFMTHLPPGQYLQYQNETPTTAIWRKMFDEGKLNPTQSQFWKPHPSEGLFDLSNDPEETNNLANDPQYSEVIAKFRIAMRNHVVETNDLGFLNEGDMYKRCSGAAPFTTYKKQGIPIEEIYAVAVAASEGKKQLDYFADKLNSERPAIRYWASLGLRIQGEKSIQEKDQLLERLARSDSAATAIVAADTLATFGNENQLGLALETLLKYADPENGNIYHAIHALTVIDRLDSKAKPILDSLKTIDPEDGLKRGGGYMKRLHLDIFGSL